MAKQMQQKPASPAKAAPKAETKKSGKAGAYAALLQSALAGSYGPAITFFYARAIAYHKKHGTAFPRARNADEPLMSPADATAFLDKHKVTSIPAGLKAGQRLFDQMMVETLSK